MCGVTFLVLLAAVSVHGAKFPPPYSNSLSQGSTSAGDLNFELQGQGLPLLGQSQGSQTGSDGQVFGNVGILTGESVSANVGNLYSQHSSQGVPGQTGGQGSSGQRTRQSQSSVPSLTDAILRALGSVGRSVQMLPPLTRTVTVTSLVNVQETETVLVTSLLTVTSHVTVSNTITTRVFKQSEPRTKTRKLVITTTSVNFVTETSAIRTFLTATATQTRYVYTPVLKTFHTTRTHNVLSYATSVERVLETQTLGVKNSESVTTTAYTTRTFFTTLVAPTNVYN